MVGVEKTVQDRGATENSTLEQGAPVMIPDGKVTSPKPKLANLRIGTWKNIPMDSLPIKFGIGAIGVSIICPWLERNM